jgi:DNA-binding beta-propeller fold protein YncE
VFQKTYIETLSAFLSFLLLANLITYSQEKEVEPIKEEWKIKREAVFDFAKKPQIISEGNQVTISFETKSLCDVTIAIEDNTNKIVRHLACGVLGPNAPEPFAKNTNSQKIVWDGKDDLGRYIDNKETYTVRVSLGLKPQFERSLLWSPKRRANGEVSKGVSIHAAPEGVYVSDCGQAPDHISLFSHTGEYIKTVYPFPAQSIKDVKGLMMTPFPQDGKILPVKPSYQMCTLLTSGDNALNINFKDGKYFQAGMDPCHKGEHARGIYDFAVKNGKIAVGANRLNRLTPEGTSGELNFYGPWICVRNEKGFYKATDSAQTANLGGYEAVTHLKPNRIAFNQSSKTLYLTRFTENFSMDMFYHNYWQHGVYKMNYEEDKEPELFLGKSESGSDNEHFYMPADIACDSKGRIYVADFGNSRVQIFSEDGKFLKSIAVEGPTQVILSPTDEIYISTWELLTGKTMAQIKIDKPFVLRKFKSFEDPTLLETYSLPIAETRGKFYQSFEIDFWAETPTIWVTPGLVPINEQPNEKRLRTAGITISAMKNKSFELIKSFEKESVSTVMESMAPGSNRQRLYFEPKKEQLYVGEGGYFFQNAISIDINTGKAQKVNLPFDAEDMAFDVNGLAYLRSENFLVRYDPSNWREVPFDYGEEREKITYNTSSSRREGRAVSGLALPVNSNWHHGGMHVAPNGNLVVGCLYAYTPLAKPPRGQAVTAYENKYKPELYPGRITNAVYGCEYVHVWDKFGKLIFDDAVKGLGTLNGVAIDNQNNIYVLSAAPRSNGKNPPFNYLAGTMMKFKPGKGKIYSDDPSTPIPLPENERPKRNPDLTNLPGNAWVEGVEWFYGGIGWFGKNNGVGCGCRNTRFALDYFGRSFAPEMDRYSVAVLDTAGNLILRIGTYGNVDDGKPLIADGGPTNTRSIGGDEVALMHGAYVATQSDRRVFIADISNYRIVSVLLNYYTSESLSLKPENK